MIENKEIILKKRFDNIFSKKYYIKYSASSSSRRRRGAFDWGVCCCVRLRLASLSFTNLAPFRNSCCASLTPSDTTDRANCPTNVSQFAANVIAQETFALLLFSFPLNDEAPSPSYGTSTPLPLCPGCRKGNSFASSSGKGNSLTSTTRLTYDRILSSLLSDNRVSVVLFHSLIYRPH